MLTIDIPITECDIEEFKDLVENGETFDWVFKANEDNTSIQINFIQEKDE